MLERLTSTSTSSTGQPGSRVGKLPAVKDIWALSISTLAAQADLKQWNGGTRTNGLAHDMFGKQCKTLLISDHISVSARDFICSHLGGIYDNDAGVTPFRAEDFIGATAARTRGNIYRRFVYCEYHYDTHDPDVLLLLKRRGLPWGPQAWQLVECLHRHFGFMSRKLPPAFRNVQFDLLANAFSTSRKHRHVTNTAVADVARCYFCGVGADSVQHMFSGECEVITHSRLLYSDRIDINTSIGTNNFKVTSYLAFPPVSAEHTRAIATFNSIVWLELCN